MKAAKQRAKELARQVIFPLAEIAWVSFFTLLGLAARPRRARHTSFGGGRVLVVAPHPDDETLGCGGTLALHARHGDAVRVLVATDGGSSRAGGIEREQMVVLRSREAEAAVSKLGPIELIQLGLPEGRWEEGTLCSLIKGHIERFGPTLIYTTSCVDFHPEHLKVAQEVARALEAVPIGKSKLRVRVYELQVPLTPALANVMVDIDTTKLAKAQALAEYRTQSGSFAWVPRHARYLRHIYRTGHDIEVFWEMGPEEYVRLMQACVGTRAAFRSVRLRPFTDGVAWLVGWRTRKRLRQLSVGKKLDSL